MDTKFGFGKPVDLGFDEAIETAQNERVNSVAEYLLGQPLLADYLEEGLDRMGVSIEDAESGVL